MTREVKMAKRIKTVELCEMFGSEIEHGGRWGLICTKHSQSCQFTNKRVAASWKNKPETWCEFCQDDSNFCYTCGFDVPDWAMLPDGTAIRHEGHELGGRN